jgi:hypothetical protein
MDSAAPLVPLNFFLPAPDPQQGCTVLPVSSITCRKGGWNRCLSYIYFGGLLLIQAFCDYLGAANFIS